MTGLLDASRRTCGITSLPWPKVGELMKGAVDAMIARGGGALGDKSVLDSLSAIAQAIDVAADGAIAATCPCCGDCKPRGVQAASLSARPRTACRPAKHGPRRSRHGRSKDTDGSADGSASTLHGKIDRFKRH